MRPNARIHVSIFSTCLALSLAPLASQADLTQGDYTYTVANGQATITDFNAAYSGALSITNTLGGCPVTSIGHFAFYYCTGLTEATIPSGVTSIGDSAFEGCASLTSITIPASVTRIGYYVFIDCTCLTAINVDSANANYWSDAEGILFNKSQNTLITCPQGKTGSYAIPYGVLYIEDEAFWYCTGLTEVTLPSSVTYIGGYALFGCTNLTSINVENANASYSSANGVLFDKSRSTLIQYPAGVTGNYTVPTGVTSLGDYSFCFCSGLTDITIPSGVTYIGLGAFGGCTSLTRLTIPASVTSLGSWPFSAGPRLMGVYFLGTAPASDDGVLSDGLSNATVYYLPGTTGWGESFAGCPTTALWLPKVQSDDGTFGFFTNRFGFTIAWASGREVIVESTTNLTSGIWSPLLTNTLGTSGSLYFTDPSSTNNPTRFYRIVWP